MLPAKRLFLAPRAADRLSEATAWLGAQGRATELLLLAPTMQAAVDLARVAAHDLGASFGWHRYTLATLAWTLTETHLAEAGKVPVSMLGFEALCARVVHGAAKASTLGRFTPIGDRPGLPRALARTFTELRLAGAHPRDLGDTDLAVLFDAALLELERARLVDQRGLLSLATTLAQRGDARLRHPLLVLDLPVRTACERDFLGALIAAAPFVLCTVADGDTPSLDSLEAFGLARQATPSVPLAASALDRLQANLFTDRTADIAPPDETVTVFSGPGEGRECVEIVRQIHRAAAQGTRFDQMAVLLRSPLQYRAHLIEAFRRGGVPAHFARGTTRPDPSGRAFLALLLCATSELSAARFAEFLSLGEMADVTAQGEPPEALTSSERWTPADDGPRDLEADGSSLAPPTTEDGTPRGPRSPRHWERLLVDASVIGGLDRWKRRLEGLRHQFLLALANVADKESPEADRIRRDLEALASLTDYALPLLGDLRSLQPAATWGEWTSLLGALATRALRHPERVLALLAELEPMASVGPVDLREVRLVLERRLTAVSMPASNRRYGSVFVASVEDIRGHAFEVVFVPGLAEKLFPQRVVEDPIVPDRLRRGSALPTNRERAAAERLALRLAVGAASKRVVLSYPRLDIEQVRPRTPSYYGLEVLRAAEGALPSFDQLSLRADVTGAVRVGWPAPAQPSDAIDAAEHDLSLLNAALQRPPAEAQGMARYLLASNVYLERSLRFREKRWRRGEWTDADGLLHLPSAALPALAKHTLAARSYSPTGLQNFAACPYRFVLQAIHKLFPREDPAPIEEIDPLERGSLIHEVQFLLYARLRDRGQLPITPTNLEQARTTLDAVLDEVAARYRDDLAPAIPRVWDDGVAAIRADLCEWLRRESLDSTWRPLYFELAFGLPSEPGRPRDARSREEPAILDSGLQLRGSIDLVERDGSGALCATDHKTGKARAKVGLVIGGGEVLQPVFYALALEKVLPGEPVEGGSLYYCTTTGAYTRVPVPLDEVARHAASLVADTVGRALTAGFLPAAPAPGACKFCDFQKVCGPYEERRVLRKPEAALASLHTLRGHS